MAGALPSALALPATQPQMRSAPTTTACAAATACCQPHTSP